MKGCEGQDKQPWMVKFTSEAISNQQLTKRIKDH